MRLVDSTELMVRRPDSAARAAATDDRSAPQGLLNGRYRVLRQIGSGGMGVVVAVEDLRSRQVLAAKILNSNATDPTTVRRFLREAVAASSLHSKHAIRVYEVGRLQSGAQYMIMELLEGEDLAQRLERGPLSPDEVANLALQLCDVLMEAHALGIVHRDIKPSNIYLARTSSGGGFVVKLLDFGVSRFSASDLTSASSVLGSPLYMSPEQMRSSRRVDPRSDIWSLGVVMYEAVTGMHPFSADTLAGLSLAIATEDPRRPVCPEPLAGTIMRCLRKRPKERFSNVLALRAALILSVRPRRGVRSQRRASARAAFGAVAGLAALAVTLWLAVASWWWTPVPLTASRSMLALAASPPTFPSPSVASKAPALSFSAFAAQVVRPKPLKFVQP